MTSIAIAKQVIHKGENILFQNGQTTLGYYSDTASGSIIYHPHEANCANCYTISGAAYCCYYVSH